MKNIRLGLCCLNTELRDKKPEIFCSRTMIRKNFTVEKSKKLAILNIADIVKMSKYNRQHNINVFRLSSNIFPRFTDREVKKYTIDFAKKALKLAGDYGIKRCNQRFLMHPGTIQSSRSKHSKSI